jgi:hypothetical protein
MAKRSQFQFRNGVPGGIFHHLQCSAGRMGISIKLLILYGKLVVNANRERWVSRGGKGDEQGWRWYSWRRVRKIGRIRATVDWTEGKGQSVCQGGVAGNGQFHETGRLIWKTDLQTRGRLWGVTRSDS